jgi:hypothetical protein
MTSFDASQNPANRGDVLTDRPGHQPGPGRYVGPPLGPWSRRPPTAAGVPTGGGLWNPPQLPAPSGTGAPVPAHLGDVLAGRNGHRPIDGEPGVHRGTGPDGNA